MTHGHEGEEEGRWGPHFRMRINKKKRKKIKKKKKGDMCQIERKKKGEKWGEASPLYQIGEKKEKGEERKEKGKKVKKKKRESYVRRRKVE